MEYFNDLIFLAALSMLSLIILVSIKFLDYLQVNTKQKLMFIKIGLIIVGVSPLLLMVLNYFSLQPIVITIPTKLIIHSPDTASTIASTNMNIDWPYYIFVGYSIFSSLMLMQILISFFKAKWLFKDSCPAIIQGQSVLLSSAISSPLSFGFPKTKIYFPAAEMNQWNSREIEISLAHETCHIKHYDSYWKLLSLIVRAILFFAPWIYFLHKRFELEMEVCCDEETLATTQSSITEYGELLLAMAATQPSSLLFTNLSHSTLKRRFLAMKSKTKMRPILTALFSFVLLLNGTLALALVSGVKNENTIFNIATKFYKDGELIAAPQIIAKSNRTATIVIADHIEEINNKFNARGNKLKIELIAVNGKIADAIKLDFDVQYQNGQINMHSHPQMIVLPKQPGSIHFTSAGHTYRIQVLAERE